MSAEVPAEWWPEVKPQAARRLMAAAIESFARRGYHATTTRDIATAAGMSPAALYVHYPSKSAVLFAISRSGHEKGLAIVRAAATLDAGPSERMRSFVQEFVAWHAHSHRAARVVQYELSALPESDFAVVAELRRQTEQTVRDLISEGQASGTFSVPDVKTAARAVLSLSIDVARWYTEGSGQTPDELGREYAALVLQMLGSH